MNKIVSVTSDKFSFSGNLLRLSPTIAGILYYASLFVFTPTTFGVIAALPLALVGQAVVNYRTILSKAKRIHTPTLEAKGHHSIYCMTDRVACYHAEKNQKAALGQIALIPKKDLIKAIFGIKDVSFEIPIEENQNNGNKTVQRVTITSSGAIAEAIETLSTVSMWNQALDNAVRMK